MRRSALSGHHGLGELISEKDKELREAGKALWRATLARTKAEIGLFDVSLTRPLVDVNWLGTLGTNSFSAVQKSRRKRRKQ